MAPPSGSPLTATRTRLRARVGEDGRLLLELPPSMAGAEVEVEVCLHREAPEGGEAQEKPAVAEPVVPRREADRKQRKQLEIFAQLIRGGAVYRGDLEEALRAITEAAVEALEVERASVWFYDSRKETIVCRDLFRRTEGDHASGLSLRAADCPRYFSALETDELIIAGDAHGDPRTSEFSSGYLAPLGIGSMLDAPIKLAGQTVGVVCHEHVGEPRRFSLEEQAAATYLASLVSLSMEVADRKRAERALEGSHSLLSATLEATADGILAVDLERRLVGFNTRFLEMWKVPDAVLTSDTPGVRLRYLASQTTDPEGYIARAERLFFDRTSEGVDIIELRDGRVFERHSKPQWMGSEPVGRVWSYRDITEQRRAEAWALREREKAERLLHNILPTPIAERLKQGEAAIADSCAEVSVLFADIVGFTSLAAGVSPAELVGVLDELFSRLDRLAERFGVEKIKTIGDSYMAAAGVPGPRPDHAQAAADLALAMREAARAYSGERGVPIALRIGIHSGPVVAGVIGIKRLIYDLWGDTVNTASRMESQGVAGAIQVSEATRARLGEGYLLEDRGPQDIKGKGAMRTFLLKGRSSQGRFAPAPAGRLAPALPSATPICAEAFPQGNTWPRRPAADRGAADPDPDLDRRRAPPLHQVKRRGLALAGPGRRGPRARRLTDETPERAQAAGRQAQPHPSSAHRASRGAGRRAREGRGEGPQREAAPERFASRRGRAGGHQPS